MSDKNYDKHDSDNNDNQIRESAPARLPEPEARPLWADWLIQTFDAKLEALESRVRGEINEVRGEIKAMKSDLKSEIKASENRLIRWAVGLSVAGITLIFAVFWEPKAESPPQPQQIDLTPLIEALKAAD